MPSRTITLLIVAGWLATAGWFVEREIAPLFRTGEPPPFVIELADEAMRHEIPTRWVVMHDGRKAGSVRTSVLYDDRDDTFAFQSEISELEMLDLGWVRAEVINYKSRYRVTRAGELRGIDTDGELAVHVDRVKNAIKLRATLGAVVRAGWIERSCRIELPDGQVLEPRLDSVPLVRGSVLNPLHPVPRITGLRPGREWTMPLIDPLADAAKAGFEAALAQLVGRAVVLPLADASAPRTLHATVLSEPQEREWDGVKSSCWVIEFRGDDFTARTWVRRHDGLVMRQEARGAGEAWVLERE
jgi:hypothetical protein